MSFLQLDETTLTRVGGLWTAREIAQQPISWSRTQLLIEQQADAIGSFIEPLRQRRDLRIILTGAGSSSFIGQCLAPFMLQRLAHRVEAIATTDLLSGPGLYLQKDVPTLLVSFARTGNSPESVAVLELAQRLLKECYHLVFTCNEAGSLFERLRGQRNGLAILLPPETHDKGFAATSSVTSMMLAAWLVFCGDRTASAVVSRICKAGACVLDTQNQALRSLAGSDYSRVVY